MNQPYFFFLAFLLILSFHYSKCKMGFKEWYEKYVRHCKPGEKFESYKPHMVCTCQSPGVIDHCEYITIMRVPPDSTLKLVGKINKKGGSLDTDPKNCATNPSGRWLSEDGCNWCFCAGKEMLCTRMGCGRSVKSALMSADTCRKKPTGKIKHEDGCNWCYCMDQNTPICTTMRCIKSGDKHLKKRLMPGACKSKPEGRFRHKDGCNWCWCIGGKELMCTVMRCIKPAKPQKKKLTGSNICPTGVGTFLATDGCNWCSCEGKGMAYCTLMLCDEASLQEEASFNKMLSGVHVNNADITDLQTDEDKFAQYASLKEKAQHCNLGDEFKVGDQVDCSECTCIETGVVTCSIVEC